MVVGLYLATFLASLCIFITLMIRHKRITTIIILFNIITTIQSFGRVIVAWSDNIQLSLLGNMLIYVGGCFCPMVVSLILIQLCKIKVPKWITGTIIAYTVLVYCLSLTIGHSDIYYTSLSIAHGDGFNYLVKDYGPLHVLMPIMVVIYFIFITYCLFYAIKKYRKVSLRTIRPIVALATVILISYILERVLKTKVSYLSIGYFLAMLLCIHFMKNINMLDMPTNIINCMEKRMINGYIQLDHKFRCAGYNEKILDLFPEVETKWNIDEKIPADNSFLYTEVIKWFLDHTKNNIHDKKTIKINDHFYEMTVNQIPYGNNPCVGYMLELFDRTAENKYLETVKNYNENLQKEVYQKTKDILQINDAFGKVVDPEVRDYILKGHVTLGGETRNVTVMFCDIRSFTAMSENMPPEKVVSMLNFYFTALSRCISKHNGIINKYIGDAIMAIFGAPIPSENNAIEAYEAAQDMRQALKTINKRLTEKGYPEIRFGIGIHTGPVLAGNIGATKRMEYTVIGDTVNTASRVESLCKEYKTDLLITESTAQRLGQYLTTKGQPLTLVDQAKIRGKEERVKLYN